MDDELERKARTFLQTIEAINEGHQRSRKEDTTLHAHSVPDLLANGNTTLATNPKRLLLKAVRSYSNGIKAFWEATKAVLALIWLLFIVGSLVVHGLPAIFPNARWAVILTHHLPSNMVPRRPHDCEFTTAPVGEKHCHYEVFIVKISWDNNTGNEIESVDDGKTWTFTDGRISSDAKPAAGRYKVTIREISWNRIED